MLDWDVSGVNNALAAWMAKMHDDTYQPPGGEEEAPVEEPTPGEYEPPVAKGHGTKTG